MKRVTLRLLGATLLCSAGLAPPALAAEPEAAQVLLSEGSTMLVRGASYSTPVRREVPIRSGDRIRTGDDGRVQLRFTDGALISIQPGTDFRVEQYANDAARQRSFFELIQGSVRAVSGSIGKRDRDDWRLRTPTATIGIRGTEFSVTETPCPASGCGPDRAALVVSVVAGRVAVTNAAGSVEVPAGATLSLRDARTVPALARPPGASRTVRAARPVSAGVSDAMPSGPLQLGPLPEDPVVPGAGRR